MTFQLRALTALAATAAVVVFAAPALAGIDSDAADLLSASASSPAQHAALADYFQKRADAHLASAEHAGKLDALELEVRGIWAGHDSDAYRARLVEANQESARAFQERADRHREQARR